jgi:hypothetical protein
MARGGGGVTNTPKLKGLPSQGSRPAGSSAVVPNGQYPTTLKTRKLPDVPGAVMNQGGPAINEAGDVTVNSTPA